MIPVTGIDFGTSYSCFCMRNETGNSFLSPDEDSPLIPSCISLTDRDIHFGRISVKDALRDNFLAFREFKPYIGQTMKDIRSFEEKALPYDFSGEPYPFLYGKQRKTGKIKGYGYPSYILGCYLNSIASLALNQGRSKISDVVLAVPVNFNASQLHSYVEAAKLAGLNVLRTVPEPCAAVCGCWDRVSMYKQVLVCDLGGGPFSISMLDLRNNSIHVVNTSRNNSFGGIDIDELIAQELRNICRMNDIFINPTKPEYRRLLIEAEQMKMALSEKEYVVFDVSNYGDSRVNTPLTRCELDDLIGENVEEVLQCIRNLIAGLRDPSVAILLIGGCSHIPIFANQIQHAFPNIPLITLKNPDTVIAEGAALIGVNEFRLNSLSVPIKNYTLMDLYYQVDSSQTLLLLKRGSSCDSRALMHLDLGNDHKRVIIWQNVNGLLKAFMSINVDSFPNGAVDIVVTFDSCGELLLEYEGKQLPCHYYCELPTTERDKFSVIEPLLCDISKVMKRLKQSQYSGDIDSVMNYLDKLRKIASNSLFQAPSESSLNYIRSLHEQLQQYSKNS